MVAQGYGMPLRKLIFAFPSRPFPTTRCVLWGGAAFGQGVGRPAVEVPRHWPRWTGIKPLPSVVGHALGGLPRAGVIWPRAAPKTARPVRLPTVAPTWRRRAHPNAFALRDDLGRCGLHFFDGGDDKCYDDRRFDLNGSSSRDLLGKPSGIVGPAVSGEGMAGAPEKGVSVIVPNS